MALRYLLVLGALAGIVAAGCSARTSPSPTPVLASESPAWGSVVVTLMVADIETYRILLTQADDIAIARDLLAGKVAPSIPNGRVVRDGPGGVNTGYSWHIDPADIAWADATTEVCDGKPSDVEHAAITPDRYCPWAAKVIAIDPA